MTAGLVACAGDSTRTAIPKIPMTETPAVSGTSAPNLVVNADGNSNVEQAHAQLQNDGNQVYLVIVSNQSTGLEHDIYQDLRERNIRATTGPDEGIDTHGEFCYPDCVFVPKEEVNAISVQAWADVLRHEFRHIVQAKNNPNLAKDFRSPNGQFTTDAAFSEACADYGLNVDLAYHAQERMDQLKRVLGSERQSLIDRACQGDKPAYQTLVDQYNQKSGYSGAFGDLFPPYE